MESLVLSSSSLAMDFSESSRSGSGDSDLAKMALTLNFRNGLCSLAKIYHLRYSGMSLKGAFYIRYSTSVIASK